MTKTSIKQTGVTYTTMVYTDGTVTGWATYRIPTRRTLAKIKTLNLNAAGVERIAEVVTDERKGEGPASMPRDKDGYRGSVDQHLAWCSKVSAQHATEQFPAFNWGR